MLHEGDDGASGVKPAPTAIRLLDLFLSEADNLRLEDNRTLGGSRKGILISHFLDLTLIRLAPMPCVAIHMVTDLMKQQVFDIHVF